jgi:hypothetical protein
VHVVYRFTVIVYSYEEFGFQDMVPDDDSCTIMTDTVNNWSLPILEMFPAVFRRIRRWHEQVYYGWWGDDIATCR